MWKVINRTWPLIIIILSVAIFFYPVWLQGKIPLPADFVVGTYYPWLDYKWGYPAGVPVKNPITTDAVSFIYPMRTYAIDLLKQGIVPLWNPLILTGTPLLANFQSAPFSPTNIVYFLLPKFDAWTLQIILQPLLAAISLYFLLREFKRSKLASLAGGLFFAFSGFMMIWMEWNTHSLVAAFFPLVMFLTLRWLKTGQVLWGTLLSIILAFQIFSGYPQIILYEFLILVTLVFVFEQSIINQPGRVLKFGLFIALGFGLTSIQILPGLELIRESQRNLESLSSELAFIPWHSLIMMFAPDYFGNHSTYNYWGPAHYTIASGYSGIITLSLAIIGLLAFFRQKGILLAICTIGIAIILGFENPLSVTLRKINLLGLQAASNQRILLLFNIGMSIMAAFGLDYLLKRDVSAKKIVKALILPVFLLVSLFLFTVASLYLTGQENLKVGLRNLVYPILFFSSGAAILFLIAKFKMLSRYLVILLICISLLELFRFGWKFTPFSSKNLIFPTTPIIRYLQEQVEPFRVIGSSIIPTNLLMPYGLETVEGYDAVYPMNVAKFLSTVNTNSPGSYLGRYGTINNFDSSLINLVNTEYVIVSTKTIYDKSHFAKVFEDGSLSVLKNTKALPRALMFYDWQVEEEYVTLGKLMDESFQFESKLILNENPQILKKKGKGSVNLTEYEAKGVINVSTDSPGLLYIANSWYPGWKAYINDRQVNILKANFNFMAIPVEGIGDFIIRVDYQPESFTVAVIITCASLIMIIFLILREYLIKPKHET